MSTLMKLSVHGRIKNKPATHRTRESGEARLALHPFYGIAEKAFGTQLACLPARPLPLRTF